MEERHFVFTIDEIARIRIWYWYMQYILVSNQYIQNMQQGSQVLLLVLQVDEWQFWANKIRGVALSYTLVFCITIQNVMDHTKICHCTIYQKHWKFSTPARQFSVLCYLHVRAWSHDGWNLWTGPNEHSQHETPPFYQRISIGQMVRWSTASYFLFWRWWNFTQYLLFYQPIWTKPLQKSSWCRWSWYTYLPRDCLGPYVVLRLPPLLYSIPLTHIPPIYCNSCIYEYLDLSNKVLSSLLALDPVFRMKQFDIELAACDE